MSPVRTRFVRPVRSLLMPVVDAVAWSAALLFAWTSDHDWADTPADRPNWLVTVAVTVLAQWLCGLGLRVYRRRRDHHFLGLAEVGNLAATSAVATAGLLACELVLAPIASWPIVLMAWPTMLAIALSARVLADLWSRRSMRGAAASAQPVIVFGAGDAGSQLVRSMLVDPGGGYRPVAVLDDDPGLRQRVVDGVPVRGGRAQIGEVVAATGAEMLVLAVPSVSGEAVKDISVRAIDAGLAVKILPALRELLQPLVGVRDLRDLDINDLLGRDPVQIDIDAVAGHVRGRRVLVTGAGGSIGSELCRQLHRLGPAELIMLDRDESALHAVQLSIEGRALLDSPAVILADIRDGPTLCELFLRRRPQIVFHTAALKHLPMLEQYPGEAWKTNVLGTLNVLEAAAASDVECFVNISTDKAANPVSVLGRSKRIGERLVAHMSQRTGRVYLSVRFGNVLGSRGSVLDTFSRQISTGQPLTITHPDVTRYFMTIPEAVELVLQAAAVGREPEVLVLDMGTPVRIVDLARQLMSLFGSGVPIVYTGLRDGEKLHEELLGPGEVDRRPRHPAISQVEVPALDGDEVSRIRRLAPDDPAAQMLRLTTVEPTRARAAPAGGSAFGSVAPFRIGIDRDGGLEPAATPAGGLPAIDPLRNGRSRR